MFVKTYEGNVGLSTRGDGGFRDLRTAMPAAFRFYIQTPALSLQAYLLLGFGVQRRPIADECTYWLERVDVLTDDLEARDQGAGE